MLECTRWIPDGIAVWSLINREAPDGVVEKELAMSSRTFDFQSEFTRRLPDPVFHKDRGMERHILFVPVTAVPAGLPMDPNARVPNIRRSVYREVRESLLSNDGRFHLKHKGITVVAQ